MTTLLAARDAVAAGFYLPDVGVRAQGRAGAFVARADDLTAAWYNPAGLALPGTRFIAEGALVRKAIVFQRTDETGAPGNFSRVDNNSSGMIIPFFAIASDFGVPGFALSFSFYGPYSGRYEFPSTGAQRYSGITNRPLEAYYQLSAAIRIVPALRVGGSMELVQMRAGNRLAVAVLPGDEGTSDVRLDLDASDGSAISGRLGILAAPWPVLDIGVSLKFQLPVSAKGSLKADQGDIDLLRATQPSLADLAISGEDVALRFAMPLVLRAGARFKRPRFDIEADYVFERWTGFQRLEIVPKGMSVTAFGTTTALPTIVQERGYGDAHSFRLGGDIDVVPGVLTARLGAFFESAAVPDRSLTVALVETDKVGVTTGASWQWRWLRVSAAFLYVWLSEKRVTTSTSRQINLTYLALNAQDQAPVVGNGWYRSWQTIASLGIAIDIDRVAGWTRRE